MDIKCFYIFILNKNIDWPIMNQCLLDYESKIKL